MTMAIAPTKTFFLLLASLATCAFAAAPTPALPTRFIVAGNPPMCEVHPRRARPPPYPSRRLARLAVPLLRVLR